ncbi:hypothetical protein, partial [uncultured Nevskia sp.]|uniref:hypothetical protein n=1 Tax=uncultured Nevskia sp. TaxID=228950 RepID=UPI0025F73BD8
RRYHLKVVRLPIPPRRLSGLLLLAPLLKEQSISTKRVDYFTAEPMAFASPAQNHFLPVP